MTGAPTRFVPTPRTVAVGIAVATALLALTAAPASAHCDAMDGPLIPEATAALETGDLTPVLMWVPAEQEDLIEREFSRARRLRDRDPEVRALADQHFLETLVRVHRASEGAPYSGIRPAGGIDPLVQHADAALAQGKVDELSAHLQAALGRQVRERFERAEARRQKAEASVAEGRAFVRAYVEYVHFVQALGRMLDEGSTGPEGDAHDH